MRYQNILLVVVGILFTASCSYAISGSVEKDLVFNYEKLSKYSSKLATIEYKYSDIDIKAECLHNGYGQLRYGILSKSNYFIYHITL